MHPQSGLAVLEVHNYALEAYPDASSVVACFSSLPLHDAGARRVNDS
jgi:hypothetical protein